MTVGAIAGNRGDWLPPNWCDRGPVGPSVLAAACRVTHQQRYLDQCPRPRSRGTAGGGRAACLRSPRSAQRKARGGTVLGVGSTPSEAVRTARRGPLSRALTSYASADAPTARRPRLRARTRCRPGRRAPPSSPGRWTRASGSALLRVSVGTRSSEPPTLRAPRIERARPMSRPAVRPCAGRRVGQPVETILLRFLRAGTGMPSWRHGVRCPARLPCFATMCVSVARLPPAGQPLACRCSGQRPETPRPSSTWPRSHAPLIGLPQRQHANISPRSIRCTNCLRTFL
jgi:hypothetical protein